MGKIHSFISMQVLGLGPTWNTISKMKHFILLYGHLSLDSLDNIEIGTVYKKRTQIALLEIQQ
jgi:hypothetical protein